MSKMFACLACTDSDNPRDGASLTAVCFEGKSEGLQAEGSDDKKSNRRLALLSLIGQEDEITADVIEEYLCLEIQAWGHQYATTIVIHDGEKESDRFILIGEASQVDKMTERYVVLYDYLDSSLYPNPDYAEDE